MVHEAQVILVNIVLKQEKNAAKCGYYRYKIAEHDPYLQHGQRVGHMPAKLKCIAVN